MFSYTVTRPYPFPWVTPIVIIGGTLATVLFSFLNVAATGFELVSVATNNTSTAKNPDWLDKWPPFLFSTRASCQNATIPIQTRLYTNNTGLPYILNSAWQLEDDGKKKVYLGSMVYGNQPLQSCNVSAVDMAFDVLDRTGGQMAVMPVGVTVTTEVDCAFDSPEGRTFLTLFATFKMVPPDSVSTAAFRARNKTSSASLYWGESIMRMYGANLAMEYYYANANVDNPRYNGVVSVTRFEKPLNTTAEETKDVDFFHIGCFFNKFNATGITHEITSCSDHK